MTRGVYTVLCWLHKVLSEMSQQMEYKRFNKRNNGRTLVGVRQYPVKT